MSRGQPLLHTAVHLEYQINDFMKDDLQNSKLITHCCKLILAPVLKKVLYSTSDQLEQHNQTCKEGVMSTEAPFL
jgi:hypothetical protein